MVGNAKTLQNNITSVGNSNQRLSYLEHQFLRAQYLVHHLREGAFLELAQVKRDEVGLCMIIVEQGYGPQKVFADRFDNRRKLNPLYAAFYVVLNGVDLVI